VIEVQDLSRRFGQHVAVDGIGFRLEAGEVVGFLGPNGAGKTTTMRMLTGYLPASRGSIQIGGFDVLRDSLEVRRRIGYLPENVPLFRELRVQEMLELQARLHQVPVKQRAARIERVLARVGLTDRRRTPIGSLSRGLRQRAGLAVALLPEPAVLILDEPTSGLDPLQRLEVRALVRELAQEHTVLLSSHILAEVEAVCPRVIILSKGKIVADGQRVALVEAMGGSFVAFEAVVGNAAEAARLLAALPGVTGVEDLGKRGIHHGFRVRGQSDLREDVGALAAQRRWAVRELSWHSPTLEKLFTRVALGLDEEAQAAAEAQAAGQAGDHGASQGTGGPATWVDGRLANSPASEPKAVYNLNPFAAGGARELHQPMGVGGAAAASAAQPAAGAHAGATALPMAGAAPAAHRPAPEVAMEQTGSAAAGGYANLNPFENFGRGRSSPAALGQAAPSAAGSTPLSPAASGSPAGNAQSANAPAPAADSASSVFVSLNPFDRFGQGRERVHGARGADAHHSGATAESKPAPEASPAAAEQKADADPSPAPEPTPRFGTLNPFENFGRGAGGPGGAR
jgi:ABC-2 type transport system ATP-binding protein